MTPNIRNFYKDRDIFITGGTGFLGKVLIYKLLHSCPDVGRIYLLVRGKRGVDAKSRLKALLDAPPFKGFSVNNSKALEKIHIVNGDLTLANLGISPSDEKMLCERISVIFHSAATVKFDDDLTKSVAMNVEGTKSMLTLAKKMDQLEAFVHVSTAYCHCNVKEKEIGEKFYSIATDSSPSEMIELCKRDGAAVDRKAVTKKIIGDRPNTYTYTKALAEQLIIEENGNLPIAIVRPSIVVASFQEPVRGWVDNLNGPTGNCSNSNY